MALDIVTAREGLKTNAETSTEPVRVFAYEPDEVPAPALIIRRPQVRWLAMGSGCYQLTFRLDLAVAPLWDRAADKAISKLVPALQTALTSDVTADSSVNSLHVSEFNTDDVIPVGDSEYVGGFFTVEVIQ